MEKFFKIYNINGGKELSLFWGYLGFAWSTLGTFTIYIFGGGIRFYKKHKLGGDYGKGAIDLGLFYVKILK